MGLFKSYTDGPLCHPKNRIVCVEDRFAFPQPVTLLLKEKIFSFSSDDFSITDVNGNAYFKCKGKVFSIREKKVLYDLYNKPLISIKNKFFSLRGKIRIFDGSGEKVLVKVEPQSLFLNKKYFITFTNLATGKEEYLEMKCDIIGCNAGIFHGKQKEGAPLICKIHRKIDAKLLLTSQDNYHVEIAPGVDASLMMALAICFDEFKNENNRD